MTIKAILFDMDDTLIDWHDFHQQWEPVETPHIRKIYDYLRQERLIRGKFTDLKKAYFNHSRRAWSNARTTLIAPHLGNTLVQSCIDNGVDAARIHADMLLDLYEWSAIPGTHPFPDTAKVLRVLRDNGLQLGVVTNAYAPMRLRDRELAHHGLLEYFGECRISAADVGWLKPHPAIFKHALDRLGTEPQETVFIGDNPAADIAGAQAVGMRAILRVVKRIRPLISGLIIPDAAFNSMMELTFILDDWDPDWRKGSAA